MGRRLLAGTSAHALLAAALASLSTLAAPAQAEGQSAQATAIRIDYNIAAQPLSSALSEFARQSGVRVLYRYEQLARANGQAVRGRFSREEALGRLLANSGFAAHIEGDSVRLEELQRPQHVSSDAIDAAQDPASMSGVANANTQPQAGAQTADEEIVVTGTRIRGRAPVGSELVTIDRDAIQASGVATTEDLMRTLPQVFTGGFAQHISRSEERRVGKDCRARGWRGA